MMRAGNALEALIAGLRGRPAASADWQSVIALANHTLLTPALFSSLAHAGQIDRLPQEVGEYLRFIHDCNRERNLRLRGQLREAVTALNGRGIVPLLIKGAVPLFLSPAGRVPSRMTSDLDICVEAVEEAAAQACLEELGYAQVSGERGVMRPEDCEVALFPTDEAEPLPGFSHLVIEGKRMLYQRPRPRSCLGGGKHAPTSHGKICISQRGIGGRVVGISFNDVL